MASAASFPKREPTPTMRRRRLLYTCGVSFLATLDKAYSRAEGFKNPVGETIRKISTKLAPALPYIHALQYLWLLILTFLDDQILALLEDLTKTIYPPSIHVFNKLDTATHIVESLPEEFDHGIDKLQAMTMHQPPLLDWAKTKTAAWLTPLHEAIFSSRSSSQSGTEEEKEIEIDISYEDHPCAESPSDAQSQSSGKISCDSLKDYISKSSSTSTRRESCTLIQTPITPFPKCSYKEVLEKGTKENDEKKEEGVAGAGREGGVGEREEEKFGGRRDVMDGDLSSDQESLSEDPILDLFESSWHM